MSCLEHDMSAILRRLHATFDPNPIVLLNQQPNAAPTDGAVRVLADYIAALANGVDAGVLVLGIDGHAPHHVTGLANPEDWVERVTRAAAALVPPVEIDAAVGHEKGRA